MHDVRQLVAAVVVALLAKNSMAYSSSSTANLIEITDSTAGAGAFSGSN